MRIEIPDERLRVGVTLSDGSTAMLSPLQPSDRQYMVEGFNEMSPESRFTRFGQGRHSLSEKEWVYLTEVDQVNHVAWAAAIDGEGAGLARYIRFNDDDCAEVAVTVLDPYQNRGLAACLLLTLAAVARADGVHAFCFEVVPTNTRVLDMIEGIETDLVDVDGLIEARIVLDATLDIPNESVILEVMAAARN